VLDIGFFRSSNAHFRCADFLAQNCSSHSRAALNSVPSRLQRMSACLAPFRFWSCLAPTPLSPPPPWDGMELTTADGSSLDTCEKMEPRRLQFC
jgi:hypothetical protein